MGVHWPVSDMKHNNQIHSVRKFRKYWQRYVKTWFNQPARKASRRAARDEKAQKISPRPLAGAVRPIVHGATIKYNSKLRIGRGFSLEEIKDAGLGKAEAQSLGIAVDYRRRNRSVQGKQANVQRLKKCKKGWKVDASAEETAVATQITTSKVMPLVAEAVEVETRKITPEEKDANVGRMLKAAWNDARLCGFREKRAKEQAEKAAQEALKKSK